MDDRPPRAEPRRDLSLGAWVVTRHADVSAALRDPRLVAGGGAAPDAHEAVRRATAQALSPERLAELEPEMRATARALLAALPTGDPVDLVRDVAAPWACALAARVAGVPVAEAESLAPLARAVFLAAAHATDAAFPPHAQDAAATLARRLAGAGGWGDVQAFVAITQTLPGSLAGAWDALLRAPEAFALLRARPALLPRAVEELLRLAGPSRAVFRAARADVTLAGATIAAGERVALLLAAANRDPARWAEPDRLDPARRAAGHLALGRGAHACPGAPLVRLAVGVVTAALLDAADAVEPAGEAAWVGGFAIRAPAALPAVLRRAG